MYLNRFRKVQFISNPSPDHSSFNDYIVTIKFHLFSIFIIIPDVFYSKTEFVTVKVSYLEPFEGDPQFGVDYIIGHFRCCVGVFAYISFESSLWSAEIHGPKSVSAKPKTGPERYEQSGIRPDHIKFETPESGPDLPGGP